MCRAYIHWMLQLSIIILYYSIAVYRSNIVHSQMQTYINQISP